MKDAELKEKIERVDALAGGVVYGKEEAWEKLQARLDAPAKKVVLPYRLAAAAAAILLLLTAGIWYMRPVNRAHTLTPPLAQAPMPAPATLAPIADTVATTIPVATTIKGRTPPPEVKIIKCKGAADPPAPGNFIPPPEVITIAVEYPILLPAPPPAKKMRIMHINDVGKQNAPAEETMVYNGPALDIGKMKVVSIHDVQIEEQMRRREEEIMVIARLNRPRSMLFSANPFATPRGNASFTANLFTIHLNRKN